MHVTCQTSEEVKAEAKISFEGVFIVFVVVNVFFLRVCMMCI